MEIVKDELDKLQKSLEAPQNNEDFNQLKSKKAPVAQYDPRKKYEWSPEDQFEFNGAEYGVILNALRAIVHTPEAHRILVAERALSVLETALANGVESGIIKEKIDEPKTAK